MEGSSGGALLSSDLGLQRQESSYTVDEIPSTSQQIKKKPGPDLKKLKRPTVPPTFKLQKKPYFHPKFKFADKPNANASLDFMNVNEMGMQKSPAPLPKEAKYITRVPNGVEKRHPVNIKEKQPLPSYQEVTSEPVVDKSPYKPPTFFKPASHVTSNVPMNKPNVLVSISSKTPPSLQPWARSNPSFDKQNRTLSYKTVSDSKKFTSLDEFLDHEKNQENAERMKIPMATEKKYGEEDEEESEIKRRFDAYRTKLYESKMTFKERAQADAKQIRHQAKRQVHVLAKLQAQQEFRSKRSQSSKQQPTTQKERGMPSPSSTIFVPKKHSRNKVQEPQYFPSKQQGSQAPPPHSHPIPTQQFPIKHTPSKNPSQHPSQQFPPKPPHSLPPQPFNPQQPLYTPQPATNHPSPQNFPAQPNSKASKQSSQQLGLDLMNQPKPYYPPPGISRFDQWDYNKVGPHNASYIQQNVYMKNQYDQQNVIQQPSVTQFQPNQQLPASRNVNQKPIPSVLQSTMNQPQISKPNEPAKLMPEHKQPDKEAFEKLQPLVSHNHPVKIKKQAKPMKLNHQPGQKTNIIQPKSSIVEPNERHNSLVQHYYEEPKTFKEPLSKKPSPKQPLSKQQSAKRTQSSKQPNSQPQTNKQPQAHGMSALPTLKQLQVGAANKVPSPQSGRASMDAQTFTKPNFQEPTPKVASESIQKEDEISLKSKLQENAAIVYKQKKKRSFKLTIKPKPSILKPKAPSKSSMQETSTKKRMKETTNTKTLRFSPVYKYRPNISSPKYQTVNPLEVGEGFNAQDARTPWSVIEPDIPFFLSVNAQEKTTEENTGQLNQGQTNESLSMENKLVENKEIKRLKHQEELMQYLPKSKLATESNGRLVGSFSDKIRAEEKKNKDCLRNTSRSVGNLPSHYTHGESDSQKSVLPNLGVASQQHFSDIIENEVPFDALEDVYNDNLNLRKDKGPHYCFSS